MAGGAACPRLKAAGTAFYANWPLSRVADARPGADPGVLSAYHLTVPNVVSVKLLIVGINRSFSYTHRSIQKELKGPLEKSSRFILNTTVALIHQEHGVRNPWSGEFGDLEQEVPDIFKSDEIRSLNGSALRASVSHLAEKLTLVEDTWGDQGRSIENALVFLKALSTLAPGETADSDIIVFARPDVLIRNRLSIIKILRKAQRLREARTPTTILPAWGTNDGLNDLFAVVPKEHAEVYFRRFDVIPGLLDAGSRFHSESFLKFVYRNTRHQSSIHTSMVRVRIGGVTPELDLRFEREHRFHNRLWREVRKKWRARKLKANARAK
jgi:hypothetical protein